MRSNGLTAPSYSPVADLDPRVADALLDDLKSQGVAAYTKPVESTTTAGFDRPEYWTGAKDRLYVDAAASADVRTLISSRDPDLLTDSDDLTWAQLVAGFDRPLECEVAPWPVDEDILDDSPRVDDPLIDGRGVAANAPEADTLDDTPRARWGTRIRAGHASDDDLRTDPERFIPDPPPPLPTLPPYKQLAWLGLIGGPLLLLFGALADYALPGWASGLGVLGFIGGFITLVATMGEDSDEDGPDNGAVV